MFQLLDEALFFRVGATRHGRRPEVFQHAARLLHERLIAGGSGGSRSTHGDS